MTTTYYRFLDGSGFFRERIEPGDYTCERLVDGTWTDLTWALSMYTIGAEVGEVERLDGPPPELADYTEHVSHDQKAHAGGAGAGGGGGDTAARDRAASDAASTLWGQAAADIRAGVADTGFTYNPTTGEQSVVGESEGFAVAATEGTGMKIENAPEKMGPEHIEQFVKENWDTFSSTPDANVGGWLDGSDNSFHLDVSIVKKDLTAAKAEGVERSQIALFDLKKGKSVTLTREDYKEHGGDDWEEKWNARPVEESAPTLDDLELHPGGRVPKGERVFIDEAERFALVKVRGGTYAILEQVKDGKFKVRGRGLDHATALHAAALMTAE